MLYNRYPGKNDDFAPHITKLKRCRGIKQVKQNWQRDFLWEMFKDSKGIIPKDQRDRASYETGLEWKQIYKWIFDRLGCHETRNKSSKIKHQAATEQIF